VVLGCALLVAALVATAVVLGGRREDGTGASPSPGGAPADLAARAAQVLQAHAAHPPVVPVPVTDDQLVQQEGDWEVAVGENAKRAFLTGHLVSAAPLPDDVGTGEVVDADGRRTETSVLSARDTFDGLTRHRADCDGCTDPRSSARRVPR